MVLIEKYKVMIIFWNNLGPNITAMLKLDFYKALWGLNCLIFSTNIYDVTKDLFQVKAVSCIHKEFSLKKKYITVSTKIY